MLSRLTSVQLRRQPARRLGLSHALPAHHRALQPRLLSSSSQKQQQQQQQRQQSGGRFWRYTLLASGVGYGALYATSEETRDFSEAVVRCSRAAAVAAVLIADYSMLIKSRPSSLSPSTESDTINDPLQQQQQREYTAEEQAYFERRSAVHRRSAIRMREALNRNGGVYIKLGQHLAALTYVLPREWTEPMAALQDKCQTTPFEDVEQLLLTELGIERLDDVFESFEREPVGTASLAQVHRAVLKPGAMAVLNAATQVPSSTAGTDTLHPHLQHQSSQSILGIDKTASAQPNNATRAVAVKIQHPYLQKHAGIDARTIGAIVRLVKKVLPEFSFEWLADELRESLPRELDFRHEWSNAEQVRANFAATSQDSLTIPKMHLARKRVLMMEFIEGSRPDDIAYLHKHEIRPERVAARLTQVFNEMVYTHGFVHCDPHPGNMLVRPRRDLAGAGHRSLMSKYGDFVSSVFAIVSSAVLRTVVGAFTVVAIPIANIAQASSHLIPHRSPSHKSNDADMVRALTMAAKSLWNMSSPESIKRAISSPSSTTSLDNFDLVLLDHGLYRTVDHSTSTNYAKLWLAMFNGDERGIERYSRRLLNGDGAYRVLAVMLTGRAWQAIEKAKVGSGEYRDGAENRALAEGAGDFLGDVADILAKLPRQVVFLLKTSDLLRGVTESLAQGMIDTKPSLSKSMTANLTATASALAPPVTGTLDQAHTSLSPSEQSLIASVHMLTGILTWRACLAAVRHEQHSASDEDEDDQNVVSGVLPEWARSSVDTIQRRASAWCRYVVADAPLMVAEKWINLHLLLSNN